MVYKNPAFRRHQISRPMRIVAPILVFPAGVVKGADAVSVGKGFGFKGKQHHKHTASETQSHNNWSHQMQRKIMEYFSSDWA